MPSTIFNATTSSGPTVYGASGTTAGGVSPSTTYDSPASVTFTTTATNTKWLIEIDAAIIWPTNTTNPVINIQAKVDGSYVECAAWRRVTQASNAGYETTGDTLRGRVVVTLATAASHTILAAIVNGDATMSLTRGTITLTATQLS